MSYFNISEAVPCEITVLKSKFNRSLTKSFSINNGELVKIPYSQETYFKARRFPVEDLNAFYAMLSKLQDEPQQFIVRGVNQAVTLAKTKRNKGIFPEHHEGTPWVMIDVDNYPLPEDVSPFSMEAIELYIKLLPSEFQDASFIYQYSSSAGICDTDGNLLKKGLNVHLFFWLDKRVPGKELAGYLQKHCLETGFYQESFDKNGYPGIGLGVDMAPLRSSCQPHYTANPIIGEGVHCLLNNEQRLGLIQKSSDVVCIPDIPNGIIPRSKALKNRLDNELKERHGFIKAKSVSRTRQGTGIQSYYRHPNAPVRGGRQLARYSLDDNNQFCTLFFTDENSPGSWYVARRSPEVAMRHGDEEIMPLKELSEDAYNVVWKELNWFRPITSRNMTLSSEGYLPDLASFTDHRYNIVLSPTGSGKTYATVKWIQANQNLVVYVAPTIALIDQMKNDLQKANLCLWHYQEPSFYLEQGNYDVVVTTADSLHKIVNTLKSEGKHFELVFDEIHQSLDVFSRSNSLLESFEVALKAVNKALFLTGTLTDLQSAWLVDCIDQQTTINSDNICQYVEFPSTKEHPLTIKSDRYFDWSLFLLLKDYQEMYSKGRPIPKTVIITSTSDMLKYQTMVEYFGLSDASCIVSRPDNYAEDIQEASNNEKPILISSPLFSLGINFVHQPVTLWVSTGHLNLSTNEVIQAINRGNRAGHTTSVTLYCYEPSQSALVLPPERVVQQELSEFFEQEATLSGALEHHLMLERSTYKELRELEKNTSKSIGSLINNQAFQNYKVTEQDFGKPECSDEEEVQFDAFKALFEQRKEERFRKVCDDNPVFQSSDAIARHSLLSIEESDFMNPHARLPRDITLDKSAVKANWCGLSTPSHVHQCDHRKLLRMHGEMVPFLTEQYSDSTDKNKVLSEKVSAIVRLVVQLEYFLDPEYTVSRFCLRLRRSKTLRDGIKALASSQSEFISLSRELDKLNKLSAKTRNNHTKQNASKTKELCLEIVKPFFQSIGLNFARLKNGKGNQRYDYDKVIVPQLWSFEEMKCHLLQLEKALLDTPKLIKPDKLSKCFSEADESERIKDRSLCEDCLFFKRNACLVDNHVDWMGSSYSTMHYDTECAQKVKIPKPLEKKLIPIRTKF